MPPPQDPRSQLAHRLRLIVITDARAAQPRGVVEVVRAALETGAPAIQLRNKGASARELHALGQELRTLTDAHGALLFVNDRVHVALAVGADGVHLGPDDLPVRAIRGTVPPGFLIGASTDDPETAARLVAEGADYLGCGTVYPTESKRDAGSVIGLDGLDRVARAVALPVIAIGGITAPRAREIADRTVASGVAVIAALMAAPDPCEATRAFLEPWSGTRRSTC